MEQRPLPVVASVMGISSGIVWSFGAVMNREADGVDAFQYLIWRSVGVIIVIELLQLWKRPRGERYVLRTIEAWTSGRTMAWANFGVFLASLCFVYAVKTTSAANAAFLGSLSPLVAAVFARVLGERIARSTIVALAVALTGLVLTVVADLDAGNMLGNVAAFATCLGFTIYTVAVRTDSSRDWTAAMPGYAILMIAVCSVITLAKGHTLLPDGVDIAWALLHGAVVIVAGTLLFTEMVFVPVWVGVVFSETPPVMTIFGGVLIFAAVIGKAVHDAGAGRRDLTVAPDVPLL